MVEPPKPEKLRVLYLTSNPDAENYLRVDVEAREVRQAVRKPRTESWSKLIIGQLPHRRISSTGSMRSGHMSFISPDMATGVLFYSTSQSRRSVREECIF
jgi:hypothetical protein